MAFEDIDGVDASLFVLSLIGTAAAGATAGVVAVPIFVGWAGAYFYRRSGSYKRFVERITYKPVQQLLLPPPREDEPAQEFTLYQDKPLEVVIKDSEAGKGMTGRWLDRISKPVSGTNDGMPTARVVSGKVSAGDKGDEPSEDQQRILAHIKKLPRYVPYSKVPDPPTPTSVPIGYTTEGTWLWGDFGKDLVHALIAGQTGSGKDVILRLWFTMLTANNSPEEVQFVIVDGKGEWLLPDLMSSKYMFTEPVGGVEFVKNEKGKWVDLASEKMADTVGVVFEEINRRGELFREAGVTDIYRYRRRTGKIMPLLIVVMTDVGTNLDKDLEDLVRALSFKGRSFGIRLIVSMQKVSGEDTGWRGNIGLAMSGFQQLPSQDAPVLGIPVRNMRYRPSALPNPGHSEDAAKSFAGLFVVRRGHEQFLVKTAHLPEEVFEQYIAGMPANDDIIDVASPEQEWESELFAQLDNPKIVPPSKTEPKHTLTPEQSTKVILLAGAGKSKTEIMKEIGVTNGEVYKDVSPYVDALISGVQRRKKKKA